MRPCSTRARMEVAPGDRDSRAAEYVLTSRLSVIIGGLLIGLVWMANLLWVAGERCRRPRRRDDELEIRGERYVRKSEAGWWDRLMGND